MIAINFLSKMPHIFDIIVKSNNPTKHYRNNFEPLPIIGKAFFITNRIKDFIYEKKITCSAAVVDNLTTAGTVYEN